MGDNLERKARILLIDHDKDWLKNAKAVLEDLGYIVHTARNAGEALKLVNEVYDLILMNWVYAEQEQVLLQRLARPKASNPRCVVVMFPVQQLPGRMRLAFKAGAYDCVDKPFDKTELLKLIKALQEERVLPKDG